MSVRAKITVAFVAVFLACFVAYYAVERATVYSRFKRLNEEMAGRNLDRWVQGISGELTHLSTFAGDWTDWDDAHDFIRTRDADFIEANLSADEWFEEFNVPVLAFYTADGEVVWKRWTGGRTPERISIPELEQAIAPGQGGLITGNSRQIVTGLLATERGPMLVVSRAIFHTDGSGPSPGFAVFARFLDEEMQSLLTRQAVCTGSVRTAAQATANGEAPLAAPAGVDGPALTTSQGVITCAVALRDLFGQPTIVVRADTPAAVSAQGARALWLSVCSLAGAGAAALVVQLLVVHRVVVRPLDRLIEHARRVRSTGDLNARCAIRSRDEIGELSREFDEMGERLAASHAELVVHSRAVGKAELAGSVTHNLGNVLNSAGVTLDALNRGIAAMRTDGCLKAAGLLRENVCSPVPSLASDGPLAELPRYLESLGASLDADRERLREDLQRLHEQIDHMSELVSAQRQAADHGSYEEVIQVRTTIDRALALVGPSLERHGVAVRVQCDEVPPFRSDPVQILQILVNLLTNAKEAMADVPRAKRAISISVRNLGASARIMVEDRGRGIAPDALDSIFRLGHTTKPGGGGIGLHYSALAARRLGGSLSVASPGEGLGAAFTLELPTATAAWRAAA